jgi:hypothetical protein
MRKKRGYKRDTPEELKRDYKLFVIACEGGKTEPKYFELFKYISSRVAVDVIDEVIKDEELENKNKSAPKWVLDRAMKYIEKEGLSKEDELWFVMDVDRWSVDNLHEIFLYCNENKNWNIALSNPCFEVWLYFHKKSDFSNSKSSTCRDLKNEISTLEIGGYSPNSFIPDLKFAMKHSENNDSNKNYYFPKKMETKIYELFESLMNKVSKDDFISFINKLNN